MSISKAQATALADGFLDDLGSSKGDLQPRQVYSEIILIAGEMVEDMQDNLNKSKNIASGKLSESILVSEPEKKGDVLIVDVMMNYYGKFVNKGVAGTRAGKSSAGYQFKKEYPSEAMLASLKAGKATARKKISNTNIKKTISHNEKKNASISQNDQVYAAARKILLYGIKGSGFVDKAVRSTREKVSDRLGAALKIDIIDSITG